jgi:predicted CXXCH cytochrome family protein
MQEATDDTVLADFNDTSFTSFGMASRFSRREGNFIVTTDGPDGQQTDYAVKYVFGLTPLQQYLLELPGGRLQAYSAAWDTDRNRWFHMYPNERIDVGDELYWTQPSQNWNFMCAECHSTDVRKGYDRQADRYDTTFFQINVGCQACHGPGSAHVAWAETREPDAPRAGSLAEMGLQLDLGTATNQAQIEACARCHARRSVIKTGYEYGSRFMDTYLPALLDERLYYADGQIQDEVYEYGSFLQSKMARKGLRCSNCHDPHSGARRSEGNALCTTCHGIGTLVFDLGPEIDATGLKSRNYDSREHHFHTPGTPGSQCVECHAPRTNYMVVDPRADHSFRIPRPDLSETTGAPDACTRCHKDRSPAWAAEAIATRHPDYQPAPHYGTVIEAGRRGRPGAARALADLVEDGSQPPIVRATAITLLERYPGARSGEVIAAALADADPLVRRAAAGGFELASAEQRVAMLAPLLRDPIRAVRIEAARMLVPVPAIAIGEANRAAFDRAVAELEASHRENQDRAEGRLSLGNLFLARGRLQEAEAEYQAALEFQPLPVPAIVNLADLYRATNREPQAEAILRRGLAEHPNQPAIVRALALALVRQERKQEALTLLANAASAGPDVAYLYALALADEGERDDAIAVLEKALPASDGNRDILLALASFYGERGDAARSAEYLQRLQAINPTDPALFTGR